LNCWAFTPAVFPLLEEELRTFLRGKAGDHRAEFYLPDAISSLIDRGRAEVDVLPTSAAWFGITYQGDRPWVAAAIADLTARGHYPSPLF
jgi:hypothetical protein